MTQSVTNNHTSGHSYIRLSPVADPEIVGGGMWPEATGRAAEGRDGVGCGRGVSPPQNFFSILDLESGHAVSVHCGTPVGGCIPLDPPLAVTFSSDCLATCQVSCMMERDIVWNER